MSATGIFAEAQATVAASLTALGLVVVTDIRNARPMTVLIDPPTLETFNRNIGDITFSLKILAAPPANSDAVDYLISAADTIMDSEISVLRGAPGLLVAGEQNIPTYDLTVRVSTLRS